MRNQFCLYAALAAAWAASATALADLTPAATTLNACYQAALKQSESLAGQYEVIVQAEERFNQVIGSVLPSVVASGSSFWQNQSLTPLSSPLQQGTVKITATQPLFQGFREYAALRLTKDALKSQKLAYQWAAWQLFSDTAQAFNLVLSAEKNLVDLRNQYNLYDQRVAFLNGWLKIGRAQETDVLSVQTAQALIKAQIEQAKYQVAASRELLAFMTGLPVGQALTDTQSIPDPFGSLASYLAALDQRPDVLAAQWNLEAAGEGVGLAFGAHLPSVVASADYYPYRYTPYTDMNWDALISVSIPIFTGGAIQSQVRAAESQKKQAELALRLTRRLDEEKMRSGHAKLSYDVSQESALSDAAALAERNYKEETRNFELGLVTNLDVLQALVTFVTTQQALDATRYAAFTDFQSLEAQAGHVADVSVNDSVK